MTLQQAFKSFLNSDELESAIDSSTEASWGGNSCILELFNDGSYRILDGIQIGNRYDSPGILITLPHLGDDEWDEDADLRFYDNAIEALNDLFDQAIKDYKEQNDG